MQSFQGISNFPKIFFSSCYLQLAGFFDVYWNSPASQDFVKHFIKVGTTLWNVL